MTSYASYPQGFEMFYPTPEIAMAPNDFSTSFDPYLLLSANELAGENWGAIAGGLDYTGFSDPNAFNNLELSSNVGAFDATQWNEAVLVPEFQLDQQAALEMQATMVPLHHPVSIQPPVLVQQFLPVQQPLTTPSPTAPVISVTTPVVPSSSTEPKLVSAPLLFEANAAWNTGSGSSSIRPWGAVMNMRAGMAGSASARDFISQGTDWEKAIGVLSKQDFTIYYKAQVKAANLNSVFLPALPDWIVKYCFGGKVAQQKPLSDRAVAKHLLNKGSRSRGSGSPPSQSKGKGKARAYPYQHPAPSA